MSYFARWPARWRVLRLGHMPELTVEPAPGRYGGTPPGVVHVFSTPARPEERASTRTLPKTSWINPPETRQSNQAITRATQRHEFTRDVAYARPYFASIDSAPRRMKPARLSRLSQLSTQAPTHWQLARDNVLKCGFSIGAVKMRRRTGGKLSTDVRSGPYLARIYAGHDGFFVTCLPYLAGRETLAKVQHFCCTSTARRSRSTARN